MTAAGALSRPSVTLKLATSLDGRIALADGQSRWITGEAARAEAHRLRAAHDAVVVGSQTVLADDPELTARTDPPPLRQPLRVVADSRGRVPGDARLFSTLGMGPVAVATLAHGDLASKGWPSTPALQVWRLPAGQGSASISLSALLDAAQGAGVASLMVEGGGQLAAAFVREGLVDRIEWFRAPVVLGGDARPGLGPLGLEKLALAPTYQRVAVRTVGPDLWESYVRKDA